MYQQPKELGGVNVMGHIKIFDPTTNEIFIDKRNAIHHENFSKAMANSLSNQGRGTIAEMVFGNGGTRVDQTGIITYLTPHAPYSDILVSCLLDFGEPGNQQAYDNAVNSDSAFVFDELGLRSYSPDGANTGDLLTHVIFHPVQKSLNRMIQIDYTVRIQSLTSGM